MTSFALFYTAIGACGIVWGEGGIVGMQLPEIRADQARARLTMRYPGAAETTPTAEIERVIVYGAVAVDDERVTGIYAGQAVP